MPLPSWIPAYIGVGSNLDDPIVQVQRGLDELRGLPDTRVVAQSHLYRTSPLGPQDQPHFINAAVALLTQLDATTLLARLKELEAKLGRGKPVVRWGPRVIDFDLLAFGSASISTEQLTVPHPGVAERSFVLRPMLDIAPDFSVPGLGSVRLLASRISLDGVQALQGPAHHGLSGHG